MFYFTKNEKQKKCEEIKLACLSDLTVLITGATGTGKSTLAEEIHRQSSRSSKPFLAINVASLNAHLIESELFGYEKGAFTGAESVRKGKLESTQGGTVFLDEIGELPPYLQVKLLDFLQYKKIYRVGGDQPIHLNVRIIAATHQNLTELKRTQKFREDFFFRLEQVHIELPSLKHPENNFDEIVHGILEELQMKYQKKLTGITENFALMLESYSWPGNYRELKSVLEYSVLSVQNQVMSEQDLPSWFLNRYSDEIKKNQTKEYLDGSYKKALMDFESSFIENALQNAHGNRTCAAEKIGMNKTTFLRKLRELQIQNKAEIYKKKWRGIHEFNGA